MCVAGVRTTGKGVRGYKDIALWPALQAGVPTGVSNDIVPSNCFIPIETGAESVDSYEFQVCAGNWPGAVANPELLSTMVQAELDAGYVEEVASLCEAKARWPQVAVGKVNIITAPGRKPRLIMDPSVSGVNAAVRIPERFTLPTLDNIRQAYPIRGSSEEIEGMTLDVSAAHKTIRVRDSEQGLLGFEVSGKYYFYKVAPFGGSFSAHWWQRLAAFFVRACHRLVFLARILLMYVDDALFTQVAKAIGLNACLLLSFCQAFGFPVSWKKLQLGPSVEFIGWQLHFRAGGFCLPSDKVAKLLAAIELVLRPGPIHWRDLDSLIGLLRWILQLAPELKSWLCTLYHDKARPLGSNFSLPAAAWQQLPSCLQADMTFCKTPPGTSIKLGSKLLSVRHVDLLCKADLVKVRVSGKRLWARIADPSTGKRKLSGSSRAFLLFWKDWCLRPQVYRPLAPARYWPNVSLAADACAHGSHIGIGGWVQFPGQPPIWFSESFAVSGIGPADARFR